MTINNDLVDQLLKDYQTPEDILGENGLLKQFTKAFLERAMQAELSDHLGYERHDPKDKNSGNSRNGHSTTRGSFLTDEAALRLIYLALRNITARWTRPVKEWRGALNRCAIQYEERLPLL